MFQLAGKFKDELIGIADHFVNFTKDAVSDLKFIQLN